MKIRLPLARLALACVVAASACADADRDPLTENARSFDDYVATLPRTSDGAYVADHDILVYDEADLYDYWGSLGRQSSALTLQVDDAGIDAKHTATKALQLTYCISPGFADANLVKNAMSLAAADWMNATKIVSGDAPTVSFSYVNDSTCTETNDNAYFNVKRDESLAPDSASFLPNKMDGSVTPRVERILKLKQATINGIGSQTLRGVLLHELGHILGFRHEHVRQRGNSCEAIDPTYRALTPYDIPSAMHYRLANVGDCLSSRTSDYVLTDTDKAGVRCLYTTQSRLDADTAADACKVATPVGATAGAGFAVNKDGSVYKLELVTAADGTKTARVWQFAASSLNQTQPVWTKLWEQAGLAASAAPSSIAAGGRQIYLVYPSKVTRWNDATLAWEQLLGTTTQSVVAYQSGDVFRVNSDGTVDRFAAGSTSSTRILTTTGTGRKLFPGMTSLYRIDSDAKVYRWTSAGWSAALGSGVLQVAEDNAGMLYALLTDTAGTVMLRNASTGVWTTINSSSSSAAKLWGGLETIYSTPADDTATAAREDQWVRRYVSGTKWIKFALDAKSMMRGGERKLKVATDSKVYVYADF
jgi:serralysin